MKNKVHWWNKQWRLAIVCWEQWWPVIGLIAPMVVDNLGVGSDLVVGDIQKVTIFVSRLIKKKKIYEVAEAV